MNDNYKLGENDLLLSGLDGSNPLAFLAALGILQTIHSQYPAANTLMCWRKSKSSWRPVVVNNPIGTDVFCKTLEKILKDFSRAAYEIDNKLPFEVSKFKANALSTIHQGCLVCRRELDILSAFGSDAFANENGIFQDTKLRMIRAGDSAGNGFLSYARTICEKTTALDIKRSLFQNWDYCDKGSSLRIDPNEDRQYALRAGDPAKAATSSMRGANRLALEGMSLMYTAPSGTSLATTGFSGFKKTVYWTWPIWEHPISVDIAKSVISSPLIQEESVKKQSLSSLGIAAVFRCRRIATSKYYNNLSPSFAVL